MRKCSSLLSSSVLCPPGGKPSPAATLAARNTAAITPVTVTGFKLHRKNRLISRRIMKDLYLFSELNCYLRNSNFAPILSCSFPPLAGATGAGHYRETVPPAAALLLLLQEDLLPELALTPSSHQLQLFSSCQSIQANCYIPPAMP